MAKRGVAAVFKNQSGTRYTIENDGIVDIHTMVSGTAGCYKEFRVTGMSKNGDCVRGLMPNANGVIEIPTKNISKVEETKGKNEFPCLTIG